MAKQVTETTPLIQQMTEESALQRVRELVQRIWTPSERSELKNLVEYLEARK